MFDGNDLAEAMGVPLYYGLVEAVVIGVYCIIACKAGRTKPPPDAPFHTMIIESYEVICEERKMIESIEILLRRQSTLSKDVEENVSENGDTSFAYYKFMDGGAKDGGKLPSIIEVDDTSTIQGKILLQGNEKQLEIGIYESNTNGSSANGSGINKSNTNGSSANGSGIHKSNTNESSTNGSGIHDSSSNESE